MGTQDHAVDQRDRFDPVRGASATQSSASHAQHPITSGRASLRAVVHYGVTSPPPVVATGWLEKLRRFSWGKPNTSPKRNQDHMMTSMAPANPSVGELPLLRIAAELFDRSHRVKLYLARIDAGPFSEYQQLTETIRKALITVETEVIETLSELWELAPRRDPQAPRMLSADSVSLFASTLGKFSKWFVTIHELLVNLPPQPVAAEAVDTLRFSFGDFYKTESPSIVLGSLLNAAEFDFVQLLKRDAPDISEILLEEQTNTVLQLAMCDSDSPLAWALLGHELGHAIDKAHGISERVAQIKELREHEYARDWCAEFCADLIAAEVLGPAPILAVLNLEYCLCPLIIDEIHSGSPTHPPARSRLAVVSDFLNKKYEKEDFLKDERASFDRAWEYSLLVSTPDEKEREETRKNAELVHRHLIVPLAQAVGEEVSQLPLPRDVLSRASIDRCVRRLKHGLPVAAQGVDREQLRRKISGYRRAEFKDEKERARSFGELVTSFDERYMSVGSIMLSGYELRKQRVMESIGVDQAFRTVESVSELCAELDTIDALVVSSIRTSGILRGLRAEPGQQEGELDTSECGGDCEQS